MAQYRKKPVIVEAVQFDEVGTNAAALLFGGKSFPIHKNEVGEPYIWIDTLEGVLMAHVGDWIIKGIKGEFYPCRDDIFQQTYEAVS